MIRDATPSDYESIAALMRAFIAWHYERHAKDRRIIDDYFDPEAFEAELAALPGPFAPPAGALLVAEEGGRVVDCVALQNFGDGSCEMKRMFVSPDMQGKGVGHALASAIITAPRTWAIPGCCWTPVQGNGRPKVSIASSAFGTWSPIMILVPTFGTGLSSCHST